MEHDFHEPEENINITRNVRKCLPSTCSLNYPDLLLSLIEKVMWSHERTLISPRNML